MKGVQCTDAVDNHFGGLGGGHYTANCKNFEDGKWYNYDDGRVSPAAESELSVSIFYRLPSDLLTHARTTCRAPRRTCCFTANGPLVQSAVDSEKRSNELYHHAAYHQQGHSIELLSPNSERQPIQAHP
jgi:hypothetical protein